MNNKQTCSKKDVIMTLGPILGMWLTILAVIGFLAGCGEQSVTNGLHTRNDITPMPSTQSIVDEQGYPTTVVVNMEGTNTIMAALIAVDAEKKTIVVKDVNSGERLNLSYTGGTDVKNVFDETITMEHFDLGEIVDVIYVPETNKARAVYQSKDVWRTTKVTNCRATESTHSITYGSGLYMYTENITVMSGDTELLPSEIMNRDQVTVRGIDQTVYSITVDVGHGYLTLTGVDNFVDGMVEIGNLYLYTITEDMMIVVPEGRYDVTVSNEGAEDTKSVYISKGMTVALDFSYVHAPAAKTGTVEFHISPANTSLYVEGEKVDYKNPVALEQGVYYINLVHDDYETYTGKLTVDSTYQIENYNLAQLVARIDGTTGTPTSASGTTAANGGTQPTTASGNNLTMPTLAPPVTPPVTTSATTTTTGTATKTPVTTSGAVDVTIQTPVGAEVYVNNDYVGIAPVTVHKDQGEYVITFRRTGYVTKSYIVDVDSTTGSQNFNFPDMAAE